MKSSAYCCRSRQTGLSLVELMIAIALGVILLLGLIQIFGGVRASFNAAEARARIQENGRFGLEFLRRDARMAGHLACQSEFYHFPQTTPRMIEPGATGNPSDRGFYNNLLAAGNASIRDNAPYVTRIHRVVEVYDYSGTGPSANYTLASATPAADGVVGNWTPALPNAGLGNIVTRAVPGSDIIVLRFLEEAPLVLTNDAVFNTATGVIPLGTAAAQVQQWGLYVMTDCRLASLFQVTATAATTVTAQNGGLNLIRDATNWFSHGEYGPGAMFARYQFVVYYIGVGANGPALMRQRLVQVPTSAAQGIALAAAEELIEGVDMMQVVLGVNLSTPARSDDHVYEYRGPAAHLGTAAAAASPAVLDDALRQILTLRVSLLIRGNTSLANAQRALDTIVVGDVNVTLPNDGRMRQTYDTTVAVRNRQRG